MLLVFQNQMSLQTGRGNVHFCLRRDLSSSLFPAPMRSTSPTAALVLSSWQDYCLGPVGGLDKFIPLSGQASSRSRQCWQQLSQLLRRIKVLWKSPLKCGIKLRATLAMLTPALFIFILYSALFCRGGSAAALAGGMTVSLCTCGGLG